MTEDTGHCVSVLSPCGKIRSFGACGRGSGPGQFTHPHGVAVDGEGNILVADSWNQKFTSEGQFLTSVGTKGSGPLQFSYPIDITLNANMNKVYVLCFLPFCIIYSRKSRGRPGDVASRCGKVSPPPPHFLVAVSTPVLSCTRQR